jgi:arsenate reductase (thioredoxin)
MTARDAGLALGPEQILQIKTAARRLRDEFAGTFSVETIQRYITDSQTRLEDRARIATRLPVLIERFTRDRLSALARLEAETLDRPAVLFLCVHNAGRSQMAAGWLRHLAGDLVDAFSGGSDPAQPSDSASRASISRSWA